MALIPSPDARILQAVDDVGDIAQQDGGIVAIGDDDVAVLRGRPDLIVGADGIELAGAVERAFRAGNIGRDSEVRS